MGISGISPMSLLLIFLIIIVLFGTKKLRNIGEDLGNAIKSFRRSLDNPESDKKDNYKIDNKN
jgi:sec-independent protein translocase protein TatA